MRRMPFACLLFALLLATGCASTEEASAPAPAATVAEGVEPQTARVFVEGRDKGTTPSTVQVRRGFSESVISLRVGKEVVREYEIEIGETYNQNELVYSFRGSNAEGMITYDATELNRSKKGVFLIPYFENPIQIEDREYGLTLIVTN